MRVPAVDRLAIGALASGIGGLFLAVRPFAPPSAAYDPVCLNPPVLAGQVDACSICCSAALALAVAGLVIGASGALDLLRRPTGLPHRWL